MFQGTIPEKALKVVANIVKEWNCERIYVGCSGNFTIERCIAHAYDGKIYSNDVTIYSSMIGKYFAEEEDLGVEIKPEYDGDCSYFRDYWYDNTAKVATLILATDIVKYDGVDFPYFKRMAEAYKKQFPEMHEKMCEKLWNIDFKAEKFYCGDVMDMLDDIPKESGFLSFPPFFKGGYEKMWKDLEKVFSFTPPKYEMFDPDKHIHQFVSKVSRLDSFCVGTGVEVPEFKDYYVGTVETHKGKAIYLYAKTDKRVYVKQKVEHHVLKIPRLGPEDDIESVKVMKLRLEDFEELRSVYLNRGIVPGKPSSSYGLVNQDNKLFGVFAFSTGLTFSSVFVNMIEGPSMYMLTDFAVGPTKVKHLSKLVLYCVLSKEVKLIAERDKGKRVRSIVTNAFSKNKRSMKYRGLFEVLNEKEVEDSNGEKKNNITYGAIAGQWTLEEGFELWKQKS